MRDDEPVQRYGVRLYAKTWDLEVEVFATTAQAAVRELEIALQAAGKPTVASMKAKKADDRE